MSSIEEFDLIVVGGGPAGSTLATFVAKQKHKVLLLETSRIYHHVGERGRAESS
jgi:flavin-dependent dehydrogenase